VVVILAYETAVMLWNRREACRLGEIGGLAPEVPSVDLTVDLDGDGGRYVVAE
jgi:hypothetical protein